MIRLTNFLSKQFNALINRRFFSLIITVIMLMLSVIFWLNKSQQSPALFTQIAPLANVAYVKNKILEPTFSMTELKPVKLPHSVRLKDNFVWYIASFQAEPSHDLWAVYIADKSWNLDVFINGIKVGRADDKFIGQPNWRTPFIASFSGALLRSQDNQQANQLAIRLSAPNSLTHISPIFIGEYELLTGAYINRKFISVTIQQIIALFIWLTFMLALFLSLKRKNDSVYFWFAVTTLMWAIHATIKLIPVPYFLHFELWRFIMNASLLWFVVAAFFFISRTVGKKSRSFEIGFVIVASLFQVAYLLIQNVWPQFYTFYSIYIYMVFILLAGMLSFYRLISSFYHSRHLFLLTLCTIIVINIGLHDYLLLIGLRNGSALLQFTAPILIILFLVQLISRFLVSLQQKEAILESFGIEPPINEEHQPVDWQKIRESERLKNFSQERQRMKQELHDGVSGSLVSVISSLRMGKSQSQQMLRSLEECMSELRAVFDNNNNCEQNLAGLLGTYRHKIESKLNMLDIALQWSVFELADDIELDVEAANHVSRIIQECFTNIIKHSQASHVLFSAKSESLGLSSTIKITINISDNGAGCQKLVKGNGLINMQQRAQTLGGEFLQKFSPQGSIASLTFNCDVSHSKNNSIE